MDDKKVIDHINELARVVNVGIRVPKPDVFE